MLTPTDPRNANYTSLAGYLTTTYAELVEAFGEPNTPNDGYKTDAEWTLMDEDGNVVTVYNYKDGKNYNGAGGLDVEDITEWHVGAHQGYDAVGLVTRGLRLLER